MLRIVAWIAAGCVLLIVVMALLRDNGSEPRRTAIAPTEGEAVAEPAPVAAPAPKPEEAPKAAPVQAIDPDQQVQDDAAAV
ncbi:MAG: hypothetical protein ABW360_12925, partial [Phenylobacterium sp.]